MSRVCGHRPGLLLSPSRVNCLWVNGSHLRASSVCVEWGIGDAESPQISWVFVFLLFSTFWWFLFTFFSFFRNAFYSSGFESGIRKFLVFSFFCPLCVLMNVWCFFTLYCYFNSLLYFPGTFFFILLVLHVIQNIIGVIFTPTPDFLLINEIYIYIHF